MKRYLPAFVIVLVIALLQTSFVFEFFGSVWNPNLILALVFSYIAVGKTEIGLFSAFMGGLILDFVGVTTPGASALIFSLFVTISVWLSKYFHSTILSLACMTFISAFIYSALLLMTNLAGSADFAKCLGTALTTTIFLFVFYLINKWLSNESRF